MKLYVRELPNTGGPRRVVIFEADGATIGQRWVKTLTQSPR